MGIISRVTEQVRLGFAKPFAIARGQLARDSNVPSFGEYQKFYAALKREQRLSTYSYMLDNVPIASAIVCTLVNLSNTPMTADTGDSFLDREVNQVLDLLDIDNVNAQLDRNLLGYGFSVAEYVLSDDMASLAKVIVLDSLKCRFKVDTDGTISEIIQRPRRGMRDIDRGVTSYAGAIQIQPEKCLILSARGRNFSDVYGHSIFQTTVASIQALSDFYDIQLKIYKRFGSPRYVIEVPADSFATVEEYTEALQTVEAEMKAAKEDSDNIIGPAMRVRLVGAEGSALRFKDEFNQILASIIAPTSVPAALLGYPSSVSTESFVRQQTLVLLGIIRNLQRIKARQYTSKLGPVLSAVYGWPVIKGFRFESPRLIEQLQENLGRELQRRLDWQDLVDGLISSETFAQR